MSESILSPNLMSHPMSDRSDSRGEPLGSSESAARYVAEHLFAPLRFSFTDGRDDGTRATRVTPVTSVATAVQALKCALTASPTRRLGSRTIRCAAPDHWHPVAQCAADRAVVTPLRESWRGLWGRSSVGYGDRA